MVRAYWNGLSRRSRAHIVVAAIGFALGAAFGDVLFVVVEVAVGDPWDELIFGIGGSALASLGYEIAGIFGGPQA